MSEKIENAKGLYLEGIRDGNIREALDRYTGARYTQHSTGVGDGKEGFIEFFAPFLERNPVRDIQVVRAIEDGQYVFVHVYQNLGNGEAQWVTADLFDTDEENRMIEHWDVIQEFVTPTASGRTMVDGPTEVTDIDKTEANKALVKSLFENMLLTGRHDKAADYISTTQYDQHNPGVEDGLDGFAKFSAGLAKQGLSVQYRKLHRLIGQGNFVVGFSHLQLGDSHYAAFDIFRIEDGLIVEHWDVQEKIVAPEQWNNGGKF